MAQANLKDLRSGNIYKLGELDYFDIQDNLVKEWASKLDSEKKEVKIVYTYGYEFTHEMTDEFARQMILTLQDYLSARRIQLKRSIRFYESEIKTDKIMNDEIGWNRYGEELKKKREEMDNIYSIFKLLDFDYKESDKKSKEISLNKVEIHKKD